MESLYKLYNAKACGELCPEDCTCTGNTIEGCRKTLDYSISTDKVLKLKEAIMRYKTMKYKRLSEIKTKPWLYKVTCTDGTDDDAGYTGYGDDITEAVSDLLIELYKSIGHDFRNEIKEILEE